MQRSFDYADRRIVVRTIERAGIGHAWAFTIDDQTQQTSEERTVETEAEAVAQALRMAKLQVDCWREREQANRW